MNAANTNMNIYIHEAQEYKLLINNTETRSVTLQTFQTTQVADTVSFLNQSC